MGDPAEERGVEPEGVIDASVILTKVRIQSYLWCASWLWILTFVRMTDGIWVRAVSASACKRGFRLGKVQTFHHLAV